MRALNRAGESAVNGVLNPSKSRRLWVSLMASLPLVVILAWALSGCTMKDGFVRLWRRSSTDWPVAGAGKDPETEPNTSASSPSASGQKNESSGEGSSEKSPGTGFKLSDGVWIDVSISSQEVKVLQKDSVLKRMTASTGTEGHETPLGTFQIQNRGIWFYSEKYKQGAKYWVSFKDWGVYLFHSLAMDKEQKVIPEEAAKLGKPASHGCIRLSVEDAKWIYDNIPAKTKVVIHK